MQCYLDMDGLLANLFDTVSQRLHRKSYEQSSAEDRLVTRVLWEDKNAFLKRIGGIERLFANLKPYPTNEILLNKVTRCFGGFFLCSHPAKIDKQACIRGKLTWIGEHVVPKYGDGFLGVTFPVHKEEYATNARGEANLLIDDYEPYIDAWRARGGVAIRLRADKFKTKKAFAEFLDENFRKLGISEENARMKIKRGAMVLPKEVRVGITSETKTGDCL
jgi:hypothetical protein